MGSGRSQGPSVADQLGARRSGLEGLKKRLAETEGLDEQTRAGFLSEVDAAAARLSESDPGNFIINPGKYSKRNKDLKGNLDAIDAVGTKIGKGLDEIVAGKNVDVNDRLRLQEQAAFLRERPGRRGLLSRS